MVSREEIESELKKRSSLIGRAVLIESELCRFPCRDTGRSILHELVQEGLAYVGLAFPRVKENFWSVEQLSRIMRRPVNAYAWNDVKFPDGLSLPSQHETLDPEHKTPDLDPIRDRNPVFYVYPAFYVYLTHEWERVVQYSRPLIDYLELHGFFDLKSTTH